MDNKDLGAETCSQATPQAREGGLGRSGFDQGEEMPRDARRLQTVARAIAPHLCASDLAKADHWAIAVDVLVALEREGL